MADRFEFTAQENAEAKALYGQLKTLVGPSLHEGDVEKMRIHLQRSIEQEQVHRDVFGLNPILFGFQTAMIVVEEIGLKRDAVWPSCCTPALKAVI